MKLPVSLLSTFVQHDLSADALGDLLTMAGFELEDLSEVEGGPVLDIKVMANRGDALSAAGLAREVLAKVSSARPTALYESAQARFGAETALDSPGPSVSIESEACTRYACLVFRDVVNGASPEWLQADLQRAGHRPISLIVDLTNYVLLELGQPLHAFDLDKLAGGRIVVRNALAGERITTLNGMEHELLPNQLMICDDHAPVAVAGIMGGLETEVSAGTTSVLLESAHFVNTSIRKTRKQLRLSTDASYRFERSVDPEGVRAALGRFRMLYREITGKDCEPTLTDVYPRPPTPMNVPFRASRARQILGINVDDAECTEVLERLGFRPVEGGFLSPTWRPDVTLEEDLIEEVGRVVGYEKIPEKMPQGTTPRGGAFGLIGITDTAKKTMLRCGLDQMISHTLRDTHPLDFDGSRRVTVRNPHSPEMAYCRDSLLPGLAEAALRNGGKDVALFEIGKVFVKGEVQIDESPELAILMTGRPRRPHWAQKESLVADFWTLKGVLEELGHLVRDDIRFDLPRDPDRRFHPTRQAGILVDEGRLWVGLMGQIHPDVAEEIGLPAETFLAELDLLVFFQNPEPPVQLRSISRNPAARRDIAVVVPMSVAFRELDVAIRDACGEVLEAHWLFDVYEGKGIPEGCHSLAIALQLRKIGENFTDEEANGVRDRALAALGELGATLR